MTLFLISDTHGAHPYPSIPTCEVCIHLGDICTDGNEEQLTDGFQWLANAPAKKKLFIPGNHDWPFEFEPFDAYARVPSSITVLEDRSIHIGQLQFFAPIARPVLYQLPHNQPTTDILLTHGPPKGILDAGMGCTLLRQWVDCHRPAFHFFGHVHETAGQTKTFNHTTFINVGQNGFLIEI